MATPNSAAASILSSIPISTISSFTPSLPQYTITSGVIAALAICFIQSLDIRVICLHISESGFYSLVFLNLFYTALVILYEVFKSVFFKDLRQQELSRAKELTVEYIFITWFINISLFEGKPARFYLDFSASLSIIYYLKLFSAIAHCQYQYAIVNMDTSTISNEIPIIHLLFTVIFLNLAYTNLFDIQLSKDKIALCIFNFESFLLLLESFQCLFCYLCKLSNTFLLCSWDYKITFSYSANTLFNIIITIFIILHYYKVSNFSFFSIQLLDFLIAIYLRKVICNTIENIKRFFKYYLISRIRKIRFPDATQEELDNMKDDVCAICLKKMFCAKKLPCNHLFHKICLQQCFQWNSEGVFKCPLCRYLISNDVQVKSYNQHEGSNLIMYINGNLLSNIDNEISFQLQSILSFNSINLPQWIPLPAFSFEIVYRTTFYHSYERRYSLDYMARQLSIVFPEFPIELLVEDLSRTRSVQQTMENIVAGNLQEREELLDQHLFEELTRQNS